MAGSGGECLGKVTSTERRLPSPASTPVRVSGTLAKGHQPTDSDFAGPPRVARLGNGCDRVPTSPRIDWELPKLNARVPGLWTTVDWVHLPRRTGGHIKVPILSAGAVNGAKRQTKATGLPAGWPSKLGANDTAPAVSPSSLEWGSQLGTGSGSPTTGGHHFWGDLAAGGPCSGWEGRSWHWGAGNHHMVTQHPLGSNL